MDELAKLKWIIAEEMDMDPEDINEEQSLREDLEMDKLNILQVMMALEVDFGIELEMEDIEQIRTVGDALSFIVEEY